MAKVKWLAVVVLLAACAGGPPAPDWQANATAALDRAVAAYLVGDTQVANDRVRSRPPRTRTHRSRRPGCTGGADTLRGTGRVAWMSDRAKDSKSCGPTHLPAERAYADYLAGRVQASDIAFLPEQHRSIRRAGPQRRRGRRSVEVRRRSAGPVGRHRACCSRTAVRIRPPSRLRSTPPQRRDGVDRCSHGWACSWRSRRRPEMRPPPSNCAGASRWSRTRGNRREPRSGLASTRHGLRGRLALGRPILATRSGAGVAARVELRDAGGTLRLVGSSRGDNCSELDFPLVVKRATNSELVFSVSASQVLRGCSNYAGRASRISDGRLEGKFMDGTIITLEKQ